MIGNKNTAQRIVNAHADFAQTRHGLTCQQQPSFGYPSAPQDSGAGEMAGESVRRTVTVLWLDADEIRELLQKHSRLVEAEEKRVLFVFRRFTASGRPAPMKAFELDLDAWIDSSRML